MRDTDTVIHRNRQGTPDYLMLLTSDFLQGAGWWVGICVEFGTSAFADTLEQAREELHQAVELQVSEMERLCGAEDFRDYLTKNRVRVLPIAAGEQTFQKRPKMTSEQIRNELERLSEAGRKWREEHPDEYDENYPPSIAWQDELYDEDGLPK